MPTSFSREFYMTNQLWSLAPKETVFTQKEWAPLEESSGYFAYNEPYAWLRIFTQNEPT